MAGFPELRGPDTAQRTTVNPTRIGTGYAKGRQTAGLLHSGASCAAGAADARTKQTGESGIASPRMTLSAVLTGHDFMLSFRLFFEILVRHTRHLLLVLALEELLAAGFETVERVLHIFEGMHRRRNDAQDDFALG